jgi:SpoIID/LytB domain protein
LALAVCVPTFVSAAPALQATPVADAWVNGSRPTQNYGTSTVLRARAGVYGAYLTFKLKPWTGRPADGLDLRLGGVLGNAATLAMSEIPAGWPELTLNFLNRPVPVSAIIVRGTVAADGVHFPLGAFFASGTIDRNSISVRVTNDASTIVSFSSREGAAPPLLTLGSAPGAASLATVADTYATPVAPDDNYGSASRVAVDGKPQAEAYLAFDTSAWLGRRVAGVALSMTLRDATGAGMTIQRVDPGWDEQTLTWNNTVDAGVTVATVAQARPSGLATIDITAAFADGVIDSPRVAFHLVTTNADGFLFSSRESGSPAALRITPRTVTVSPPPTPTASPSPAPTRTPGPTRSPSPAPTRSPSPAPTASPTVAPTATPTPVPLFHFRGQGSEHGVGMSQYGARGRAAAGQTYDVILAHYYTGTTLGTIDPSQPVRVMLNSGYVPTASAPARIIARLGGWTSAAFVDEAGARVLFPADSYVQLDPVEAGWQATAFDATGAVLATVATTDLTIDPADVHTRLQMTWRSSLTRYVLYRGSMRLLVAGTLVQGINIVAMDDYVKGVVPAEMPPLWPIEAVKVQAVAARGYAYRHLRPDRTWDVVPTADNQVYGGASLEHLRSNLAVDGTAGQVVMYNGVPANTFFFTVAGGYTENNEFAWPGSGGNVVAKPIPYLRGQPDYDANGLAYDRNAPGFAWQSGSFTWAQLSAMMAADARTRVGTLSDIQYKRGVSGRVYCVTLVGSARTVNVAGGVFKSVFNANNGDGADLRSTMYYLEAEP